MFPLLWILCPLDGNPIDCFLQGVVGACGISVLCNLIKIHLFIRTCSEHGQKQATSVGGLVGDPWKTFIQFWCLTALLSMVGSRVSSLLVLEFTLRVVSAWMTTVQDDPDSGRGNRLLLIQCQFSLGCVLTGTLDFLQQGAVHSSFSLLLAAGLSWFLMGICRNLWSHIASLYPLHSTERYCGKCITLMTSGHTILASLQRVVFLAFAIGSLASISNVYRHFLSQNDALKFWIPLTLCYTMLVVSIQAEQHRQSVGEALLHTVLLRLGSLLVLMLTVGQWSDVLHVLISFLGEAVCLLQSKSLMGALLKIEEDKSHSKKELELNDPALDKQLKMDGWSSRQISRQITPTKSADT